LGRCRCSAGKTLVFAGHTDVVPTGPLDQWLTLSSGHQERRAAVRARRCGHENLPIAAMVIIRVVFLATTLILHCRRVLLTSDEVSEANGTVVVYEQLFAAKGAGLP
jgi:succinyl-diaminopimelate desuccinylase